MQYVERQTHPQKSKEKREGGRDTKRERGKEQDKDDSKKKK